MIRLITSETIGNVMMVSGKVQLISEFLVWFLSYVIITACLYIFYLKFGKDKLYIFKQSHVLTRLILSIILTVSIFFLAT